MARRVRTNEPPHARTVARAHITADSPKAMPSVTPNLSGARTPVDVENLARLSVHIATVSRAGDTSRSLPVSRSKMNPLIGTDGEIHGCNLAFCICSLVLSSTSLKL